MCSTARMLLLLSALVLNWFLSLVIFVCVV